MRLLRLKVIAGHNLAKKDIFGASDPYVKIDLVKNTDDSVIDSVYTKTKKRVGKTTLIVSHRLIVAQQWLAVIIVVSNHVRHFVLDVESRVGRRVHFPR